MRYQLAKARRFARRLAGRTDPIILMYHRVAEVGQDPWRLAVDPANFEAQMALLTSTRFPVPLDWLVDQILAGKRPERAVAITFDDGYRDVLDAAKPILDRHGIPATVFLTTGGFGLPNGFWWDRLAAAIFTAAAIPQTLTLSFAGQGSFATHGRTVREIHLAIWRKIRVLRASDQEAAVAEVAAALGSPPPPATPVMSRDDVRVLISGGAITVGAHTITHPSLPCLSDDEQRTEMRRSRDMIEAIAGEPIRRLAYPFGDFNAASERIAREIGFDYAVSTRAGTAVDVRDRYRLPRYGIENWPIERFEAQLRWY